MGLLQMKYKRDVHYRDLSAFGDNDLIRPEFNIVKLIAEHILSPSVRTWCFYVYEDMLNYQMEAATDMSEKFHYLVQVFNHQ